MTEDLELRETLAATQKELRRLQMILESLPVGVLVTDASGKAEMLNSALDRIWRGSLPLDNLEQYRAYRAWSAEGDDPVEPGDWPISQALKTGDSQPPRELRIERFDGTTGVILSSAVPIRDEHGHVVAAAAIAQDITHLTERRRANRLLAQQATVLNNMIEAVNIADSNGTLLYTNPGLARMFGYEDGEILGRHVSVLNAYSPEENETKVQQILESVAVRGYWQGEIHNRRKDGTTFFCQATVCTVEVEGESWFISVQDDITTRRLAEEERLRLHREERHLRQEAEAALRARDEFVAIVSHELRTPLSAIVGWTQILRTRPLGDPIALRAVETIERNAKAQVQLIEDLLDMSRILSGRMRLEIARVDPATVLASAVETVRHAAEARGVELSVDIAPALPEIEADASRLQQVFWNLLSNAVKFTSQGGRVDVHLETRGEALRFTVRDTGKGIFAEFLPYVFDRFRQQENSATRRQGGLGLGLSIVRNLVELHGGTVEAASDGDGRGSCFSVELPLPPSSRDGYRPQAGEAGPDAVHQSAELAGRHILLVEDDRDNRDAFAESLRQHGAEVTTAASGAEALEHVRRGDRFDCLVCDIGMPDMDGHQVLSEIRALGVRVPPAIALTAFTAETDRTAAIRAGFDEFLPKPVSFEILAHSIAALLGLQG